MKKELRIERMASLVIDDGTSNRDIVALTNEETISAGNSYARGASIIHLSNDSGTIHAIATADDELIMAFRGEIKDIL